MKIRFYCDVPKINYAEMGRHTVLSATSTLSNTAPLDGYMRVGFDVEMPPEVLRRFVASADAVVSNVAVEPPVRPREREGRV